MNKEPDWRGAAARDPRVRTSRHDDAIGTTATARHHDEPLERSRATTHALLDAGRRRSVLPVARRAISSGARRRVRRRDGRSARASPLTSHPDSRSALPDAGRADVRRSCSWPTSIAASARRTSARRSRRRSGSRSRSGSRIRSAGTQQIHPDDKQRWSVEAARDAAHGRAAAFGRIACSPATAASSGSTARPGWSGATTGGRGSSRASAFDITRPEAGGGGAAGGAQRRLGDPRHGRRAGRRARSARAASCASIAPAS